jgi:hypothetical protein
MTSGPSSPVGYASLHLRSENSVGAGFALQENCIELCVGLFKCGELGIGLGHLAGPRRH